MCSIDLNRFIKQACPSVTTVFGGSHFDHAEMALTGFYFQFKIHV
jgi:hypothetical protein